MIEWGPALHLRFGANAYNWSKLDGARLWDTYPGDHVVDICGLGIHDHIGVKSTADWNGFLRGPWNRNRNADLLGGHPGEGPTLAMDGILDWYEWSAARNRWLGTAEIEMHYEPAPYFPRTCSPRPRG